MRLQDTIVVVSLSPQTGGIGYQDWQKIVAVIVDPYITAEGVAFCRDHPSASAQGTVVKVITVTLGSCEVAASKRGISAATCKAVTDRRSRKPRTSGIQTCGSG